MYTKSDRTGWDRIAAYKEMLKYMSPEAIDALADDVSGVFQGSGGLAVGDVVRAAKSLPGLKSKDHKVIEGTLPKLRENMREDRRRRRKGKSKLDPEDAMKIWITTTVRLLRESGLNDTASQKAWLRKGGGYIMQKRAISGVISIERTPIPDGFMPQVGRPRKEKSE